MVNVAAWMWFFVPPALLAAVFPGKVLTRRARWLCYGWPIVLAGFAAGGHHGKADRQQHRAAGLDCVSLR
jgi:hypothetical protein